MKKKSEKEKMENAPERSGRAAVFHIFGPAALEYVRWILSEAKALGLRRIYFLARDGWFFYLFAKRLAQQEAPAIECRYLYCSRAALRIPLYHKMPPEACMDRIFAKTAAISPAVCLKRSGIPSSEWDGLLQTAGWKKEKTKLLTTDELAELRTCLSGCSLFLETLSACSEQAWKAASGYLLQEGLHEPGNGIADSGWLGTMQQSLEGLLQTAGYPVKLHGFYFGMYGGSPPEKKAEFYHTFYFDVRHGMQRKLDFNNNLFETVFSSPEGMTEGYLWNMKKNKFFPITEENRNRDRMLELETIFKEYLEMFTSKTRCTNPRKELKRRFRKLMITPSKEEVDFFGAFTFSEDISGLEEQKLARPLTRKELYRSLLPGKLLERVGIFKECKSPGAWPEGSIAVLPGGKRGLRLICRLTKYIRYKRMEL